MTVSRSVPRDSYHPAEVWSDSVKCQFVNSRSVFFRHPNPGSVRPQSPRSLRSPDERSGPWSAGLAMHLLGRDGNLVFDLPGASRPPLARNFETGVELLGHRRLLQTARQREKSPYPNVRRTSGSPSPTSHYLNRSRKNKIDSTSAGSILTLASDELFPVGLSGTMTN